MTVPRSLADDVLLLAIDDRARYRTRGAVGVVLAAAELCDRVVADQASEASRASEVPAPRRRRLVAAIRSGSALAPGRVGQRLAARGVVAPAEHRVLGLFPRRGHAVVDVAARSDAEHRLRTALTPGARPDRWTATLALLCAVSGIARAVAPPPQDRGGRRDVAGHLNGMRAVVGEPLAEVVDATRAAYGRSGRAGDGFVPASGADCYGDSGGAGSGGDGGGDGGGGGGD